ncbi:MAG TPA: hypothetical protein VFI25_02275 [Planctomycetota bacterium]|jgi:hypothetical protein|nr:hypothetical protein [Planctomycetota bacterium]
METVRVDISYRPLRIAWAIRAGDRDAFREAVRLSHAFWGGRFNPIVVVDRPEEAGQLVELFRVDMIHPVSKSEDVREFRGRFPHLMWPLFEEGLFIGGASECPMSVVLDIHNALVFLRDTPDLEALKMKGVRIYSWRSDDPLADVFLGSFGAYPEVGDIGIDYRRMVVEATEAREYDLDAVTPIPGDVLDHPSIGYLSGYRLQRHFAGSRGWEEPGFFLGDATNVDDLVCYWNLQASDIRLLFVDESHLARYAGIIEPWYRRMRDLMPRRGGLDRQVAVWSRREDPNAVRKPFGALDLMVYPVSPRAWNGLNVRPPTMHFGRVSTLGVIGTGDGRPRVSFALPEKPFTDDSWFHMQHLVASVSFVGGLYGDDRHTLKPPFIPELNEFYGRKMHFEYNTLRIGPDEIGLVVDVGETDAFLYGLRVADCVEKLFAMAGFSVAPSRGGLIARQLIALLGGLQGARVFKIPGVRRLLRTHGPLDPFTMQSALQLIGGRDDQNPDANFSDYYDLYIEPRPQGTRLEPPSVLAYMVEKGLFRMGAWLTCPGCRMASWVGLDTLRQRVACEMCGQEYDASRQLAKDRWYFRRSGILGSERHAQGAVPVALTLQQLETNLGDGLGREMYSTSLDVKPTGGPEAPIFEIDFVWIDARSHCERTLVMVGECKDRGPIKLSEFERDVEHLRRIADAFPERRFETFVVLTKLNSFTAEEIECAKRLNAEGRERAILLAARELEPYHIYDRTKLEFGIDGYAGSPQDLARVTAQVYFGEGARPPRTSPPPGA